MDIQTTAYDSKATLRLKGRFQFDSHREFRSAYEPYIEDPAARVVVVDFSGVDYLDSSALGMLLLLRDHAGGDSAQIRLLNCNPDVRKILAISNFEQLFKIA